MPQQNSVHSQPLPVRLAVQGTGCQYFVDYTVQAVLVGLHSHLAGPAGQGMSFVVQKRRPEDAAAGSGSLLAAQAGLETPPAVIVDQGKWTADLADLGSWTAGWGMKSAVLVACLVARDSRTVLRHFAGWDAAAAAAVRGRNLLPQIRKSFAAPVDNLLVLHRFVLQMLQ